ncbi:M28 family peptidase [Umboniibacter marinipuniceus]|uniref:Peptidase M28-like protein n=1 Tax=Umboniibacter marinipuniceus TaxID=569599 RepID=A0A3L9ZYU0_9GAMM|nr:M28 family metallopeptidase [Umboniibacter marinipuniceus]RMA77620.1 peptidase M28-like protein [Umboniibacter marinipuniceus]
MMLKIIALTTAVFLVSAATANTHRVPPAEDIRLYDIGQSASAERLHQDVEMLVSFGTRHSLSETQSETTGIGAARRWIAEEFAQISNACGGCLEVMLISDTVEGRRIPTPTEIVNVIAVLKGKKNSNRYVVMSGDIDSRVSDPLNSSAASPGANDNASGVAGVIEAARVLSKYEFDGNIVFAALSGEEQGLYGGKILADYAAANDWHLQAVINNDMIGNIAGINGVIDNHSVRVFSEGVKISETPEEARERYFSGGENDSASRNLARFIKAQADQYMTNLDVMLVYRLDRFGRGGHHFPFNQAGYPAVRIMEVNEHYDRQHQDLRNEEGRHYGDTIDYVDFDFTAKLTSLNTLSLAALAWAPAPPAEVKISGQVAPSTTLTWQPVDDAAGYRVYWRLTTESEWTHSRWVGNVSEFTLENMVIDNYLYGVSSVSVGGHESPVVFPGAAGDFY